MSKVMSLINKLNNTYTRSLYSFSDSNQEIPIYNTNNSDDDFVKLASIEYSKKKSDLTIILFSNLYYMSEKKRLAIISLWMEVLTEENDDIKCPYHEKCLAGLDPELILDTGRDASRNEWTSTICMLSKITKESIQTKINIIGDWMDSYRSFV